MSRGPGHLQRTIKRVFEDNADAVFPVTELAERIYGKSGRMECKAVRRAADPVAASLGWMRRKIGGRVDYARRETVNRMCERRTARAKELLS